METTLQVQAAVIELVETKCERIQLWHCLKLDWGISTWASVSRKKEKVTDELRISKGDTCFMEFESLACL